MRPIFHLYGHIALKFNIKPVCDVFLKTQDLKSLPISNGNLIFASKKGKIFFFWTNFKCNLNMTDRRGKLQSSDFEAKIFMKRPTFQC